MISKEVLKVSKEIYKFGANHVTVSIFASIVFFTIKDMQIYCLDSELGKINVKESNLKKQDIRVNHAVNLAINIKK
tara:strand:+ start:267 stop:494 length:228 start_codon:yes stop_codon:yes gene_type:complete